MLKIGVIIPTRNDRPGFIDNYLRMLANQTIQPFQIKIVDDAPDDPTVKDITLRYRKGYDALRGRKLDVIAFMEDDDYYAPDYLETMLMAWIDAGRPDLFGTRSTVYYNIRIFSYLTMRHEQRSSAMSTLIKPDLCLTWPANNDPYTDVHLYKTLPYKLFAPDHHICMGIKHGIGLCGGGFHNTKTEAFHTHGTSDLNKKFLREVMDAESFDFYSNYLNHNQ